MSMFVSVPAELRDDLKMCLNLTPDLRPDAAQFSKVILFCSLQTISISAVLSYPNTRPRIYYAGKFY